MTQIEKAHAFKALHIPGAPLVLYNIWDAGSAQTLAKAGAAACATGSWSVAAAQGYADGEAMPLPFALQVVARITASVDLPVSIDFEGGYAVAPDDLSENVSALIRAGAIGLNFEDRVVGGEGMHAIAAQADRVRAVRAAAEREGVPLFINARTDVFLQSDPATQADHVAEAMDRAAAYKDAGADGFFIPGLSDFSSIEAIVAGTDLPVNVMMRGDLSNVSEVAKTGIARASFGPGSYIRAMEDLAGRVADIV